MSFKNWYKNKYFETDLGYIVNGEALEVMSELIKNEAKFDAIITDVPQEITENDWDRALPLEPMWDSIYELRKSKTTPIVIFTNQPFTTSLISSNIKDFKYMRYWQKTRPTNFLNAKRQPLRDIEEIAIFKEEDENEIEEMAVFYEKQCTYNPQYFEGKPLHGMGCSYKVKEFQNNNYGNFASQKNPSANRAGDTKKYPRQLMKYKSPYPLLHPTQKPLDLVEELVLTYTNKGDIVLDFTAGSMTTGLVCENLKRRWICIELDREMCEKGKNRFVG